MAGQQTLDLRVEVRVLIGQQKKKSRMNFGIFLLPLLNEIRRMKPPRTEKVKELPLIKILEFDNIVVERKNPLDYILYTTMLHNNYVCVK